MSISPSLNINPNAARYFLVVARVQSFRRAGDVLHVARSAVSRQISLLERNLGAALFERSRGRTQLRLTAAGEVFLVHARSSLNALERAVEEIEALKGLRTGSIALGVPETFTHEFLPEFLADFNREMPRIGFDVTVANSPRLIDMLLQAEIEVALAYNPGQRRGMRIVAQLERPTYMMMHKGHPLAKRKSVRISECAQYPIVMPASDTSMRDVYDGIFAKLRIRPNVTLVTSSYEMLRSAARVGLGLAVVNEYLSPRDSADTRNVAFVPILDFAGKPQTLACCVREEHSLSVAATVLVERISAAFRRLERGPARRSKSRH